MVLLAVFSPTPSLAAQDWSPVGGALAGVSAGALVGLGYFSARARAGKYIETAEEATKQMVAPVLTGLVTGIVLGVSTEDRLDDTVLWAAVGWASGLGIGALIGSRLWDDPQGPWAGAAIGGAAGLLVGGIVGFVRSGEGNVGVPAMIRIPL
jgi:hypothetical protein